MECLSLLALVYIKVSLLSGGDLVICRLPVVRGLFKGGFFVLTGAFMYSCIIVVTLRENLCVV